MIIIVCVKIGRINQQWASEISLYDDRGIQSFHQKDQTMNFYRDWMTMEFMMNSIPMYPNMRDLTVCFADSNTKLPFGSGFNQMWWNHDPPFDLQVEVFRA